MPKLFSQKFTFSGFGPIEIEGDLGSKIWYLPQIYEIIKVMSWKLLTASVLNIVEKKRCAVKFGLIFKHEIDIKCMAERTLQQQLLLEEE